MTGAPGQASGKIDGLQLVDVGPTILDLYGIDATEALPGAVGRSFLKA
jgi:predicted AlkP superfamily phosphohydrolase/phosphomutase